MEKMETLKKMGTNKLILVPMGTLVPKWGQTGSSVNASYLIDNKIIANAKNPIKVLGDGELDHPINVKVQKFSESAKSKIISAGGTAEEI